MSFLRTLSGLLLPMALYACAAPQPGVFAVPVIEDADEAPLVAESPVAEAPVETAAVFTVTFEHEGVAAPLTAMRMVMEPGAGAERAVELVDDELTLTGTAEAIAGEDRWLVGVSGVTASSCIVVRMTAERDGAKLRGWAVIDADGSATALPFVAEPTG